MLLSVNQLLSFTIQATDDAIGEGHDLLFDDRFWTCRFLAVDTHPWIPLSHKVLISPVSIVEVAPDTEDVHLSISREKVKSAPSTDTNQPVSRDFERAYFNYFGFGHYWVGPGAWGEYAFPTELVQSQNQKDLEPNTKEQDEERNHLRSVQELKSYSIRESDDTQGHVCDFIIDTYSWSIVYLVIDTRDWFPGGRKVLMLPSQFTEISWPEQALKCDLSIEEVKSLPEYQPDSLADKDYLQKVRHSLYAEKSRQSTTSRP